MSIIQRNWRLRTLKPTYKSWSSYEIEISQQKDMIRSMISLHNRMKIICHCNGKIRNLNLRVMEFKNISLKVCWEYLEYEKMVRGLELKQVPFNDIRAQHQWEHCCWKDPATDISILLKNAPINLMLWLLDQRYGTESEKRQVSIMKWWVGLWACGHVDIHH